MVVLCWRSPTPFPHPASDLREGAPTLQNRESFVLEPWYTHCLSSFIQLSSEDWVCALPGAWSPGCAVWAVGAGPWPHLASRLRRSLGPPCLQVCGRHRSSQPLCLGHRFLSPLCLSPLFHQIYRSQKLDYMSSQLRAPLHSLSCLELQLFCAFTSISVGA